MTVNNIPPLNIDKLSMKDKHNNEVHELRKEYLPKIFLIIKLWLGFIALFVSVYYLIELFLFYKFNKIINLIPAPVLISLLGFTSANIIGLFYVVAKWLFPNTNNKHKCKYNKS